MYMVVVRGRKVSRVETANKVVSVARQWVEDK